MPCLFGKVGLGKKGNLYRALSLTINLRSDGMPRITKPVTFSQAYKLTQTRRLERKAIRRHLLCAIRSERLVDLIEHVES